MDSSGNIFNVTDIFQSTYTLPDIVTESMANAKPIWEVLGLSESQYLRQYPAENEWTSKVLAEKRMEEQTRSVIDLAGNQVPVSNDCDASGNLLDIPYTIDVDESGPGEDGDSLQDPSNCLLHEGRATQEC